MLELKHIEKSFQGRKILEDININIEQGEIVSILGPSGSGKTTLLNIILGLEEADKGTICYNGQLYNKKDLQQTLLEKGFNFDGNSDTEVLLKAFICYGYDVVHYLNGVFAFAIWDELKKELFMSRDHFGIKPFYYSILENNFIFSSEVKAFFKFPSFPTSISQQGISELIGLRTCSHSRNNCI